MREEKEKEERSKKGILGLIDDSIRCVENFQVVPTSCLGRRERSSCNDDDDGHDMMALLSGT